MTDIPVTTSLTSSRSSPPLSPRISENKQLKSAAISRSTHNLRSTANIPPINIVEVRKKDQINLKEKDQKTIKKIRSTSLNKTDATSIALISPRVDKGRIKGTILR